MYRKKQKHLRPEDLGDDEMKENSKELLSEERLGREPMAKLIIRTTVPMLISMVASMLYNFADSVLVARLHEDALTALTLAAPFQTLISACGSGISVGMNAVISRALGQGERKKAERAVTSALFLGAVSYVLIIIVALTAIQPYFYHMSGGNVQIERYGREYLGICLLFSFGHITQWIFDRLLISTGKSAYLFITLMVSSVVNLILDPVLIFGLLGVPAFKTAGAAIATVTGQICGGLVSVFLNLRYNRSIKIHFWGRPDRTSVLDILKVGIPTFFTLGAASLNGMLMNSILLSFSTTTVAVYGACNKIRGLATVPNSGISNSLIPIVAYNYGSGNKERIYSAMKGALLFELATTGTACVILIAIPGTVLSAFNAAGEMLRIGTYALRVLAFAYILSCVTNIFTASLQALGRGVDAMVLNISGHVVFPLLFTWALSKLADVNYLWFGFLAAELILIPFAAWLFDKKKPKL